MTVPAASPVAVADVIAYFCRAYPHKSELSNARLTKLVYLADWRSAQRRNRQLTSIRWLFNHYGPWVPDVLDAARHDRSRFVIRHEENAYGSSKTLVELTPNGAATAEDGQLSVADREILDDVIAETERMYFGQFIDFVYKTYPVAASARYEVLDLPVLAAREREDTGVDRQETGQSAPPTSPRASAHGGLDAERYAELRATINAAVSAELGRGLAEELAMFYPDLQTPTLQAVESTYDLEVTRGFADRMTVSVLVDAEAEGFVNKSDFWAGPDVYTALDADWNDHMMWVAVNVELRFTFEVDADESDDGGRFSRALTGITVVDAEGR